MNKGEKTKSIKPSVGDYPVYLLHGADVSNSLVKAALEATIWTLDRALPEMTGVIFAGKYHPYHGGSFLDVEYYENKAFREGENGNLNIETLFREFANEPNRKNFPHYDVFLTDYSFYYPKTRGSKVAVTREGVAAIISFSRLVMSGDAKLAVAKTIVYQQLGYLFGLRKNIKKESCPNKCAMRRAENMDDFSKLAQDLIRTGEPFCPDCTLKLYQFFHPDLKKN